MRKGAASAPELAFGLSTLCFAVLGWRVHRVFWLFKYGQQTEGKILGVRIVRDRGRVSYSYHFNGRQITNWCPVHRTKQVLALRPEDSVQVLVNKGSHPSTRSLATFFNSLAVHRWVDDRAPLRLELLVWRSLRLGQFRGLVKSSS